MRWDVKGRLEFVKVKDLSSFLSPSGDRTPPWGCDQGSDTVSLASLKAYPLQCGKVMSWPR